MRTAIVLAVIACGGTARADLLGHDRLREHVDRMFARTDVRAMDAAQRDAMYLRRPLLTVGLLVPVLGTYRMEQAVFGELRPAVVIDWVLGGLAPVALGITALETSGRTRRIAAWSAIGLYAATRAAILVIGSLHISEYNRQIRLHLGAIERTAADRVVPGLMASTRW